MRNSLLILIGFLTLNACGQKDKVDKDFAKDFRKALDKDFSEKQLDKMFSDYNAILTPGSDITQLSEQLKGHRLSVFPLDDFKNDKLYKNNIDKLLRSGNDNHRLLAYLVIASSGDTSKESILLEKIKTETRKGNLIWAGMALLHLRTNHTTPLFDFLVKNEEFGDAHMLPIYLKLNKDSLRQTAYSRINSGDVTTKVLAAQILSVTTLNSKTEELLKQVVREWSFNIKGYAVYSIAQLQIGNLLETLRPLLDSSQTKSIALEALANSPTEADRNYLIEMVNKSDTVPEDLLDCFYKSKSLENLKYWLKLLYTKPIPLGYYFNDSKQPLIHSDSILSELQTAIQKTKDADVLDNLVMALKGRTDTKSTGILISLLSHENSSVRYWAGNSLKGNHSPELIMKLPGLLEKFSTRGTALTDLAIENDLDTLQGIFENIYQTEQSLDWQRSSVEYLSTFPKERHKEIFRKILENKGSEKDEDTFIQRCAALGLGRLKDESSVDLIISACEKESAPSDFNAQMYLKALGMIKGNKAKAAIEKYKNSHEENVRELVAEILKTW